MKKYSGEKKLMMLNEYSTIEVLPLKVLCHEIIISNRSKEADFNFIKSSPSQNEISSYKEINPLSANPKKWPNTLKKFVGKLPTNCLSVFGHFIYLALKGLILDI